MSAALKGFEPKAPIAAEVARQLETAMNSPAMKQATESARLFQTSVQSAMEDAQRDVGKKKKNR